MFDLLLESSHRDDSNKWSNIGFGDEKMQVNSIEVHFTHLILSSAPKDLSCVTISSAERSMLFYEG